MQRLEAVAGRGAKHADYPQTVAGAREPSAALRVLISADPLTASDRAEFELPTHFRSFAGVGYPAIQLPHRRVPVRVLSEQRFGRINRDPNIRYFGDDLIASSNPMILCISGEIARSIRSPP